jgi:ATP-binding cassette subfamily C exporter for protease/lipase/ATP-binding cassette subfamily C protein EexD
MSSSDPSATDRRRWLALRTRLRPILMPLIAFSAVMHVLLLGPSLYMLLVYDRVLSSRSQDTLLVLTGGVLIALSLNALLDLVRTRLLMNAGMLLERELGVRVLAAVLSRSARWGQPAGTGELRDIGVLRNFLTGPGALTLLDLPWLPMYLAVIGLFHPLLALCALTGMLLLGGLTLLTERLTRPQIERALLQGRQLSQYMEAGLRNAEVVNALGMGGQLAEQWMRRNEAVQHIHLDLARVSTRHQVLGRLLRQVLQVMMMALGAWLVLRGQAPAGVMIAATLILGRLLQPLEGLLLGWKPWTETRQALQRLDEVLARHEPDREPMELPRPRGRLDLERVIYSPVPGTPPILKGLSLSLLPGESLAIIGPSGSGKSTLARLMVGLLPAQAGSVRLDGAEISQWSRQQLGPQIGYVPQDVELFAGSVAENIARLGPVEPSQVIGAARAAGAHEMILRLPQGYATDLGGNGHLVSAGQRQRIALARALHGAPQLVVMDEPNANLDTDGEQALITAMKGLRQLGVTQIIVTHRPLLLAAVDKVLVLRDGQIERFGPRDAVLAQVLRPVVPPTAAEAPHLQPRQAGS